jgi:cytochrome c oxidase subunit 2
MIDLDEVFWNYKTPESHPEAVRIEVNAHQWAWDVRYPGNDGVFKTKDDVVLLNDMRVPVGIPVIVQMASVDVLHSFYLPNLRVKQDVVPGTITRVWFQATEEGEWDIACAQHCGTHHYKMKALLTTLEHEEWNAWMKQASAYAERGYDPDDATAHWGWEWKKEL